MILLLCCGCGPAVPSDIDRMRYDPVRTADIGLEGIDDPDIYDTAGYLYYKGSCYSTNLPMTRVVDRMPMEDLIGREVGETESPMTSKLVDARIMIPDAKTLTVGGFTDESEKDKALRVDLSDTLQEYGWVNGVLLYRTAADQPVSTVFIRTDWKGYREQQEQYNRDMDAENAKLAAAVQDLISAGQYDISEAYHLYELTEDGGVRPLPVN